jgi:hypothetical protein
VILTLLDNYGKSINSFVIDVLKAFTGFYLLEFRKIKAYIQALKDYIFCESQEFYHEILIKFVVGELNVLEFAQKFSDRLLADKNKPIINISRKFSNKFV